MRCCASTNYAKIPKLFYGALKYENLRHADEIFHKNFHLKPRIPRLGKSQSICTHACTRPNIKKMCMTKNFSHSHAVSYYFVKMCRHGRKKEKNSKTFLCLSSCVYVLHALLLLAFHSISTDDDSHRTIVRRDGNEEGGKKVLHKRLKLQAFVTFFFAREFNIHKTHDKHTV